MSLQTWKEEFYPTEAGSPEAQASPIEHSLIKWKGLTKENLDKHAVKKTEGYIWIGDDNNSLCIDSDSCSLCLKARSIRSLKQSSLMCEECEIHKNLNEECDIEYATWCRTGDPTTMISLLTRTLDASKTSTP